jgi:hypothetical protein
MLASGFASPARRLKQCLRVLRVGDIEAIDDPKAAR